MPRKRTHRPAWLLFPVLLATTTSLVAQTSWIPSGTGDWNVSGNWDNGAPNSTIGVFISNGGTSILSNATGEAGYIKVGTYGNGSLRIENGGYLTANYAYAGGFNPTEVGVITVTGSGSTLSLISTGIYSHVGQNGTGTWNILDGGLIAVDDVVVGDTALSTGEVLVSGSGSKWRVTDTLKVGDEGTGTVTASNGGIVDSSNPIRLAIQAGSKGTLKIGDGSAAGMILAPSITGGAGTAEVIFSQTDASYTFAPKLEGSLKVTHSATGTTILTGTNTYSGTTTISAGTLQIGNGGTAGTLGSGAVLNSGVLAFNRSDAITVGNLISGTGQLKMLGSGTLTITGSNNYTGGTTISNGTLVVANDNALGPFAYPSPVVLLDGSNATLQINSGITLRKLIKVENGGTINNAGLITGTNAYLIYTVDTNLHIVNTGTISGGEYVIYGENDAPGLKTVRNTGGLITTTDPWGQAIYFNTRGDVINEAGGVINGHVSVGQGLPGESKVLNTGSSTINGNVSYISGSLINTGASVISSTSMAAVTISLGAYVSDPSLTNSGSSTIRGLEYGVVATNSWMLSRAVINNIEGSVIMSATTSDGIAGIYMDSQMASAPGTVNNGVGSSIIGRTYGVYLSGGGSITNEGTISKTLTTGTTAMGVRFAGDPGTLINSGTINGGVRMDNYANSVTLITNSVIDGNLLMGNQNTSKLILGGSTGTQLYSTAVTGSTALSGTLVKQHPGTWILDRNLTTRAVSITGGTLQIGNSGTTGSIAGNVANAGTLAFNRTDSITYSGTISGAGKVVQSGSGILILTGNNTYSGGTTITSGTLQIGNGGTTGVISGNVTNDGTLVFNRSDDRTFGDSISGTGSLVKLGGSRLILSASNSFTGATQVTSGTLALNNNDALSRTTAVTLNAGTVLDLVGMSRFASVGSIAGAGTIDASELLQIFSWGSDNTSTTFSGSVVNNFLVSKQGTGTTTLTGSNSFSSLVVAGGVLKLDGGGTLGSAVNLSVLGGVMDLNGKDQSALSIIGDEDGEIRLGTSTLTVTNARGEIFFGVLSGSGNLTLSGTGAMVLAGSNTLSGTATVANGTLQIGNGETTGSIAADIFNQSAVIFKRSNEVTYGSVISGTGTLTQSGSGTLILTGSNTYTGATTIAVGTLQIGNGGTVGILGSGGVINDSVLAFNRSDSITVANSISGSGELQIIGSGTTTLSATNTYTGATDVKAGTLRVNGALTSSTLVTVHSGGILGGSGTIAGPVNVLSGGHLSAGNSPGTLSLGSLTLNSGSVSDFELGTSSDLVAVTGDLTIGGILNLTNSGGFDNTSYTLFTYGGTLTNQYFELNLIPEGWNRANFVIDLTTSGEVNLLVDNTVTIQYWDGSNTDPDGTASGGNGTWSSGGANWTNSNGSLNNPWEGVVGVFGGIAGTVAVADDVTFKQLQFETDGYELTNGGGSLVTSGSSSELWMKADVNTTIAATVSGTAVLRKTGSGTVTLSASNTHSGGTVIANGTVRTENEYALGTGNVTLQSLGTLNPTGELSIGGDFIWEGGVIQQTIGDATTTIHVTGAFDNSGGGNEFSITTGAGFAANTAYTLLTFGESIAFTLDGLIATSLDGLTAEFQLINSGNTLQIIYLGAMSGPILQNSPDINTPTDRAFTVDGTVETGKENESNEVLSLIFGDGGGSITVHNTLKLGSGAVTTGTGNAAILSGTLHSESGFTIDTDGDLAISSVVTTGTSGGLTKSGTGTLKLFGSNTYAGGTVINAGTVQTGNTQALGSGAVTLNASATLAPIGKLTISSFIWNGGVIAFSQGNIDTLEITGNFIKGTEDEAYVFSLASSGFEINTIYTLLSFDENVGFSISDFRADTFYGITAEFAFVDNTLTVHYTGAVSGPVLQNSGTIFTPLDSNFLVSGSVTTQKPVESNTVNSLLFAEGSSLTVNNTLTVTSGNFTVMSGSALLTGDEVETPGNFKKLGSGTLTTEVELTVTGSATIEEGGLIVNGELITNNGLLAQQNTLLGGSGVIYGNVTNNGLLSPGNSPGTLTVVGNHAQTSSSVFLLEIASKNHFDRLLVSGTASLAGSLAVVPYGGFQLDYGQKFTFINAGKIVGAFDSVSIADGFRARILLESDTATLLVAPESYTQVAQTPNQKSTAKALDSFIPAIGDDRETVSIALDELTSSEYPAAFEQIAPNFYESLARITIEQSNAQGQMLQQRFGAVRLGVGGFQQIGLDAPVITEFVSKNPAKETRNIMEPAADNPWGVWVQGNGLYAKNAGLSGVPNFHFNSGGFLVGADYRWGNGVATGFYAGYQGVHARYDDGSKTRINAARFGGYATLDTGNGFYGNAILGGGLSDYDVRRTIKFSSIDRTARSNPNGGEFNAILGGGYDWTAGNFSFGPVASGQYTYVNVAGFTENGARSLNLRVNNQEAHSLRSTLGARVAYSWEISQGVKLIPEARVTWQHEFLQDSRTLGAALDAGSGPEFSITTTAPERDAVFAGIGLNLQVADRWGANLYYNADFGSGDFKSQMLSGGFNIRF